MRRGRILTGVTLAAACVACLSFSGVAGAATPADICQAIANGTFNAGNYTAAELAAYRQALASDSTIQGYCSPLPALPQPQTCQQVAPNTAGASEASNGTWYANAPGGNANNCVHSGSAGSSTPPGSSPGSTGGKAPTSGVKGASKTKTAPPTRSGVLPARHTSVAPLSTTRSSGTLPFTGLQLGIFVAVGLALLTGGALLRLTTRRRSGA